MGVAGAPGRGGVSRGRGDAALEFTGETPGRTDQFEARELDPAEWLDPESTAIVGVGATAPTVDPAAQGGGLVETRASAGRAAWKRRVSAYSRGMARRLALAAAWVHRPRLLVLDEPTSGLDPLGTEEILGLLDRHKKEGGATLLSTHDRVTAEGACDRALVLHAGGTALEGPPRRLLEGDAGPSLAGLLRRAARG